MIMIPDKSAVDITNVHQILIFIHFLSPFFLYISGYRKIHQRGREK